MVDGVKVAEGIDTWMTAPVRGEHRCTLIVQYDCGRLERNVSFGTDAPNTSNDEQGSAEIKQ